MNIIEDLVSGVLEAAAEAKGSSRGEVRKKCKFGKGIGRSTSVVSRRIWQSLWVIFVRRVHTRCALLMCRVAIAACEVMDYLHRRLQMVRTYRIVVDRTAAAAAAAAKEGAAL